MVKTILQQIMVYWAHLYVIPTKILNSIRSIMLNFLWSGRKDKGKMHLARWELIMKPIEHGGWAIKEVHTFGRALLLKSILEGTDFAEYLE